MNAKIKITRWTCPITKLVYNVSQRTDGKYDGRIVSKNPYDLAWFCGKIIPAGEVYVVEYDAGDNFKDC